jgi:serine O-acetyltransferase
MILRSVVRSVEHNLSSFNKIAVWGAGRLGRQALREWLKGATVKAIVDSNTERIGSKVDGVSVISPAGFFKSDYDCVIICVTFHQELFSHIKENNFGGEILFVWDLFKTSPQKKGELYNLLVDIAIQKDGSWIELFINNPQIILNISYRFLRYAVKIQIPSFFLLIMRGFHALLSVFFSISIPETVEAGPGLVFHHYGGIVIHRKTVMGAFCVVYQGVTIGSNYSSEVPKLGNYVTLYAGSMVLGNAFLADYTIVGANSVVIDLVCDERGKSLVGNPAKVL